MRVSWKLIGVLTLILLGTLSFFVVRFYVRMGGLASIEEEIALACEPMPAPPGAEDVAVDAINGIAFVSAHDRRADAGPTGETPRGGLYLLDMRGNLAGWRITPITPHEPVDLRPHGIGYWKGEDGERRLFVVNHGDKGRESVEIYSVTEDHRLIHQRSVTSPHIVSPNDVAAIGPESFYVTNDHSLPQGILSLLGDVIALGSGDLVHYDGRETRVVAGDQQFPNGVWVSADGTRLYLTETLGRSFRIYDRDRASGALTQEAELYLGTGLDNIAASDDGRLYIGAHPNMIAFLGHASDPSQPSPSQVLEVVPDAAGGGAVRTIYLNDGTEISGLSVAAPYKDWLILDSVFGDELVVCERPN